MSEKAPDVVQSDRFWDMIQDQAEQLNFDPTDFENIIKKDVITLEDLSQALSYKVSTEVLESHAKEKLSFYKKHMLWGDLPESISLDHKVIVPFPALRGLDTQDLTRKIFGEYTKLLARTVSEKLKNQEYSTLNWWFVVKTFNVDIDNQVLISYKPKNMVSFSKGSFVSRFNSLNDLMRSRRGSFSPYYSSVLNVFKDRAEDSVSISRSAVSDRVSDNVRAQRLTAFFSVWPVKKRLRLLSQLSFPFTQEQEDTFKMFLNIPTSEWNEEYMRQNPSVGNKVYSIVKFEDLHDFMMLLSRKKSTPLQEMDQSSVLFLQDIDWGRGYKIRVPKTNHDLDIISYRLNNCVGRAGYFEKVKSGNIFILEVLKDGSSFACLEVDRSSRRIIQAKLNRNQNFDDYAFRQEIEKEIKSKLYPSFVENVLKFFKRA